MEPAPTPTSPEISTQEQDEKSTDDTAGIGRSYECGFCKRGFTNAQALGGHMNIHRKDRAKAKQKTNYDEQIMKSNEKCANIVYYDPRRVCDYMSGGPGQEMNYQVYLPSPNPNSQFGNLYSLQPVQKAEVGLDPNLSLRIGQSEPNVGKEIEVDLELRLGYGIKNDKDK